MGMNRFYDQDAMERLFGWRTSAYQRIYDEKRRLAPNIAIYTPMYVHNVLDQLIHVLNVVGYALDHPLQPDFLYFTMTGSIYDAYKNLFIRIFHAAHDTYRDVSRRRWTLCYAVPVGWFRWVSIWLPAFRCVRDRFSQEYPPDHIHFMGLTGASIASPLFLDGHVDIGLFPANITTVSALQTTLFINAWDPHSIPGNGNTQDNSLDGHMGRATMIGVLGWGATNHYLLASSRYVLTT